MRSEQPTNPHGKGIIRVLTSVFRVRMDPETGRIDADLVLSIVWPGERAGVWKTDWTYQGLGRPAVAGLSAMEAFSDLARSIYDDYAGDFVHDNAIMDKAFDELDLTFEVEPAVAAAFRLRP